MRKQDKLIDSRMMAVSDNFDELVGDVKLSRGGTMVAITLPVMTGWRSSALVQGRPQHMQQKSLRRLRRLRPRADSHGKSSEIRARLAAGCEITVHLNQRN
jgi:hypothetical protein